jgi:predicted nucleotidyltransferase
MNEEIIKSIRNLIDNVNRKIELECVILFGSQARNEAMPHSDIDLIFIGDFKKKFIKRSKIIYDNFNFEIGKGLDAFCYTPLEFETMFYEGVVSILDSIDEGICLYGEKFFKKFQVLLKKLKEKGLKKDPPVWILPKSMEIN